MAHLQQTTFFKVPMEALNDLVRDPRRVPDFWIGMSGPHRVFGDGGPGSKAEYTLAMMGLHQRFVSRTIEERHNPDGSTDWRWEYTGGMTGSLTCHHQPREDGVEATTDFDYTLRGGVFGRLLDRAVVQRRVRRDFEESLENLKLLAEASVARPMAKAA
jgi:Polyketide cyclase / dehydrase and lipid transport